MIIKCPITGERYERLDVTSYHEKDCPFCKRIISKSFKQKNTEQKESQR